uniref:Uncharacterized protein n=1 Tax=Anguilla anguilla TaxID=7936 RepID=A0A0E9UUJ0_ANGAN
MLISVQCPLNTKEKCHKTPELIRKILQMQKSKCIK